MVLKNFRLNEIHLTSSIGEDLKLIGEVTDKMTFPM